MLRLVAVVGTVPAVGIAIGYRMRAVQASESKQEGSRVFRSCDLPIYPTASASSRDDSKPPYPRNAVEEQIGNARRSVQGFFTEYQDTFDRITSTFSTGYEHSAATIDYIQNNPTELPRVMFIAVAGLGGVVLGYRGGIIRKLAYGSIAGLSAAAVAYPSATVAFGEEAVKEVKTMWKESGGDDLVKEYWPFSKEESKEGEDDTKKPDSSSPSDSNSNNNNNQGSSSKKKLKGDPGQSNPEDKDMYSTRSS